MSNKILTSEQINELKELSVVTYISKKQINFRSEFKIDLAQCNTLNEARILFKDNGIKLDYLGEQRIYSLYSRYKSAYKTSGAAAFLIEKRGRKNKNITDNKTYNNADLVAKLEIAERRLKEQEEEIDMLKKFTPFLPRQCKKGNKFKAIELFISSYSYKMMNKTQIIKLLCNYLSVSLSGYYKHTSKKDAYTIRKIQNKALEMHIREIQNMKFRKSGIKYKRIGYRQMTLQLNNRLQFRVNHKRIARIMKDLGLQSTFRKKNPYKTMPVKDNEHKEFENLLDRNFDSPIPGSVICTDITYLICNKHKAYLSAMKDATTGKILAYEVSSNLKMDFVLNTVDKLPKYLIHDDTIIQSDQGFHYTNPQYVRKLAKLNVVQSMSRKGKCIDNSPIESFFGHFKDEVLYEQADTLDELKEIVDQYMTYYNYQRPQLHKEKMTPHQRECHLL